MIYSFCLRRKKNSENPFFGLLFLLVVASVAILPYSAESFQRFDLISPPSSMPASALHIHFYNAILTRNNELRLAWRSRHQRSTFVKVAESPTGLSAHYLTTALEGLWEDRMIDDGIAEKDEYQYLSWIDLESRSEDSNGFAFADSSSTSSIDIASDNYPNQQEITPITLPLYPLGEVHLPLSTNITATPNIVVNHTLNNVEPQNIKMALDLLSKESGSPRFCVVLRAIDTGRIATVGNIFRIVDADVQKFIGANNDFDNDSVTEDNEDNDEVQRICLTCQSEGLAEILEVKNGSGWAKKRLLRSDEYLQAQVRRVLLFDDQENDDGTRDWKYAYDDIRNDLRTIKLIYQLQLGSEDYPPDTLLRLGNAIQDCPELHSSTHDGDALLWNLAQEWQSICMTLRQGRQALLATERNEQMVAALFARGGPLKLPIHLTDLEPKSRLEIQKLDEDFQNDHELSGMDPILDFQVLIGIPTTNRRFDFLAKLVARERFRLQNIASASSRRRRL